ncbi:MAG: Gfo/Idh/MocA family oxidoreductase, partial [Gemmatimonadota bacterium]|nr:Gfo/Idh/MocA family oxidoreductase [Gemmatimonadota bacterium]
MTPLDRREFIAGTAGVAAAVAGLPGRSWAKTNDGKVRLGFIGVGGRGTHLLELALRRSDTVVNAVCDISEDALSRATDLVREHSGVQTAAYGDGDEAFLQLVARDDLDAVVIATPWRWHTTMAVAAMRNGKAAGVEVPAAVTLQECWDLVNTSEETGMACMLMENVCYRRDVMAVFNMVKQGMFGELMHMHCGYQHDLRN